MSLLSVSGGPFQSVLGMRSSQNGTISNWKTNYSVDRMLPASSFRNVHSKLDQFQITLSALHEEINIARATVKDTKLKLTFTKGDLLERHLPQVQNHLRKSIQGLEKIIAFQVSSNKLRFETLDTSCQSLATNSKACQGRINQIYKRLLSLEAIIGHQTA